MADIEAFPPSPGVVPNFVDPESHRDTLIPVIAIGLPLTILFVVIRLYTRQFITKRLGFDDCRSVMCYICYLAIANHSRVLPYHRCKI